MTESPEWHQREERGTSLGIRATVWIYRVLGRRLARVVLLGIVTYFFLFGGDARRASRAYLERLHAFPGGAEALGHAPTWRDVFRHIYEFGAMVLDRVGFWLGGPDDFAIEVDGWEELERVVADGRGALFLGSHLGSFDSMRLLASYRSPIAVHVLMYVENAARINDVLRQLADTGDADHPPPQVIPITPGSVQHALDVRAKLKRGEVVAILADRVHPNEEDRVARVDFLGGRARLPEGPFLLAGTLRCPVLMMTSVREGPGRYHVTVERLADSLDLPRSERAAAVRAHAQDYAKRLEAGVLRTPHQWFNFFPFWEEDGGAGSAPQHERETA